MKITSVPQMTEITIKMVYNGKEIETSTRVLTTYGDGLLVTPVICEGQVVDYCRGGSFVYRDPFTGGSHTFILDSIARTDFNGGNFHVLTGKENLIVDRKRKAERYMVQKMGLAQINKKINVNLMINDISMRGISLLLGNDHAVNVGDEIKLTFFGNAGKRMVVECKVVRLFDIQGIRAAGCVFKNVTTDIITYVLDKKSEYDNKMNVRGAG